MDTSCSSVVLVRERQFNFGLLRCRAGGENHDFSLLALLLGALQDGIHVGPIEEGPPAVWLGMYLQAWGLLFIVSYFSPRGSYLLKGLMWICENWSHPRGRWTALLWGVFAIGMGTIPLLQGLGVIRL